MDVNKTYRLSKETVEQIAALAKEHGLSMRRVIEQAIRELAERLKEQQDA